MEPAGKILVMFAGPILMLLAALGTGLSAHKLWRAQGQYWRSMRRLAKDWLHDVMLPDGPDGETFVEHVALLPGGILVATIMDFRGAIFGAANMDYWTQVLNRRSYRFPNPAEQLKAVTGAVRAAAGEEHVVGHVMFSNHCSFPKGVPEGVSTAREMNNALAEFCIGTIPESRRQRWEVLKRQVSAARFGRAKDSCTGNWNRFVFRAILALGLVVLSIAWAGWVFWRSSQYAG